MTADLAARDLLRAPALVSLARIPLAAAFPFVVDEPTKALSLLSLSGATDMLDGHLARTLGQVTPMGAVVDGMTDKVFVLSVAASLLASGRLTSASLALLGAREIAELPLAIWLAGSDRHIRATAHTANRLGKVTTTLQFSAVTALLFGRRRLARWLVGASAVVGVLAAMSYWNRVLR